MQKRKARKAAEYICGVCGKRIPVLPRGGMVAHKCKRGRRGLNTLNTTGQARPTGQGEDHEASK